VDRGDREDRDPCQHDRVHPIELLEIATDLVPVAEGDAEGEENERGGERQELRREEEACSAHEALEESIGVDGREPEIQDVPADPRAPARETRRPYRLSREQAELLQFRDELLHGLLGDRGGESRLDVPARGLERRRAVELLG